MARLTRVEKALAARGLPVPTTEDVLKAIDDRTLDSLIERLEGSLARASPP
jgi:hypothetical protein